MLQILLDHLFRHLQGALIQNALERAMEEDCQGQKDVPAGTSRNQWGEEVPPGPEPVALRRADALARTAQAYYTLAMAWVRLGLWERPWARLNPGTKPSAASGLLQNPINCTVGRCEQSPINRTVGR
jgi:hypothetical protein